MEIDKLKSLLRNHIKGLIYGQALGDAVGLQMEFKNKSQSLKYPIVYPYQKQIRNFQLNDFTDDTDQMILLLDTIIESQHNFYDDTFSENDILNFSEKLLSWKDHGFPELGDTQGLGIGSTINMVVSHENFLKDPINCSKEIWINSNKRLAANGAMMRTSVLSIMNIFKSIRDPLTIHQDFYKSIKMMCLVTHYDLRCILSCWILCYLIQRVYSQLF